MPFASWLVELRKLLAEDGADEWTDADVQRYYREGHSPKSAAAELRFRVMASS